MGWRRFFLARAGELKPLFSTGSHGELEEVQGPGGFVR